MGKKLFLFAAAAVALASCTETDLSGDTSFAKESTSDAIQFSAKAGNSGVTRAVVAKNYSQGAIGNADGDFTTSLQKARFGVFAYHTSTGNYNPATVSSAPSNIAPNFMYNQELIYGSATTDGWVYDPVKYWPNGIDAANVANNPSNTATELNQAQRLSFFAYAPYMEQGTTATDGTKPTDVSAKNVQTPLTIDHDGDAGTAKVNNGIVAISDNTSTANVWVKYVMPVAEESKAVDLLWGVRGQKSYSETDGTNNTVDKLGNSYNINLTKQTVDEKVKFLFKHALTKIGGQTVTTEDKDGTPSGNDKIGFKIVADVDINTESTAEDHDDQAKYFGSDFDKAKTLITLKSIKIQDGKTATADAETSVTGITTNSGIFNSGWFNIETGQWSNQEVTGTGSTINIVAKSDATNQDNTDDADYSINPDIREATGYTKSGEAGPKKLVADGKTWDNAQKPTGIYTTAVPVFAQENIPGVTLIPGTNQDLYITVDYFVRTADPNLASGYSLVEQVISNKISLATLESNKYYTIIMHLGMTSVKFEAVVADWVTNNSDEFDEEGHVVDPATPTENESHIWLPSNVITSQNITINLAADATSSSVTLNSMEEGAYTSDKTDIIASGTVLSTETGHKTLSIGGLTANESTTETKTTVVTITDAASKVYTITIIQAIKP